MVGIGAAMVVINLDKIALTEASREILARITDFTPLLRRIGEACEKFWVNKFRAEGPGWKPLQPATLARRRKEGAGAKILRDEGRLFASLEDAISSEGGVFELSSHHLAIGTNLKYAAIHQTGGTIHHSKRYTRSRALGSAASIVGGMFTAGLSHGQRRANSISTTKIPARPFLPTPEEATSFIEPVIERYFKGLPE